MTSAAGQGPLDSVSFTARLDPVPHWHAVSRGLAELGWDFELTFRLARDPAETEPPMWVAHLLERLAGYVEETGNWFEQYHHMDLGGDIAPGRRTLVRAVAFVQDPELPPVDGPRGPIRFLQVVGLTGDEYAATQSWSVHGFLQLLARRDPLLITDLDRPSATDDPEVADAVERGERRDGSATASLSLSEFGWRPDGDLVLLAVGANVTELVARTLRGRLPFGRSLLIVGPESSVDVSSGSFSVGAAPESGGRLELVLTDEALDGLLEVLVPFAGVRAVPSGGPLVVEVVRVNGVG
jgi:hypothetical protein